jgi:hypothetical protein
MSYGKIEPKQRAHSPILPKRSEDLDIRGCRVLQKVKHMLNGNASIMLSFYRNIGTDIPGQIQPTIGEIVPDLPLTSIYLQGLPENASSIFCQKLLDNGFYQKR